MSELIVSMSVNPTIFLYAVTIAVFIMDCVVEGTPLMLVLVPLFVPTANHLGVDLVQFALVFEVSVLIGQLTPPVGITMYVTCQIGEVSVVDYTRAILPFLGAAIVLVILIIHFPQLTTWVPNFLLGVPIGVPK